MKKIFAFFGLLLVFISGCSCKKEEKIEKFYLEEKYYYDDSLYIPAESYDAIQALIDNKESFALLVYESSCSLSSSFISVLNEYLEEKRIVFHSILMRKVNEAGDNDVNKNIKYRPSVILFNEGKYVTGLKVNDDKHTEYYKDSDKFGEWFETYVKLDIEEANNN